ncbi:MAG: HD domain-containing protein [Theionarchaea archaeon]|nr:HD domain-containing protein [Theionarchaea archaeon]
MSYDWGYKHIRDPIHGFVGISKQEIDLIDTPPMQRLRRIKQLACAELVYPGAVHTRFEHSIGTLFVANEMARKINLSNDERKVIRIACLLHDLGHGPFSHIFDAILSIANSKPVGHEEITVDIIRNSSEISEIIGDSYDDVIRLLGGSDVESATQGILSSDIDADKLDYLQRDSYHTGVTYGCFDFKRILLTLLKIKTESSSYLEIDEKGKDALENYKLAKLSMHKQVYQHHVRVITDAMIKRMGELAIEDNSSLKSRLRVPMDEKSVEEFLKMDDMSYLKDMSEEDEVISEFANRLMNRDLFKVGLEIPMEDINSYTRWDLQKNWGPQEERRKYYLELEKEIADEAGIDPKYIIIYIREIENIMGSNFKGRLLQRHPPIHIRMKDGTHKFFDDITSLRGRSEPETRLFVFCPKEIRSDIELCKNVLEA